MLASTVVVTGAGSGIGRAVVLACAAMGSRVAALDIDAGRTDAVAEQALLGGSPQAIGLACDVSVEASVREAFDRVADVLGGFDAVCANAGMEINAPLHTFDPDCWRRVIDVNLVGIFLTCREALNRLVSNGSGASIVCTSSPAAFLGHAGGGNSAYAASKGGVSAFVRSAAVDYAAHGIRINAVVPGATETPMLLAGCSDELSAAAELDRIRSAASTQIPLGRLARPEEIAAPILWLMSSESSYVTGAHLICDGGLMAKSPNDF